MLKPPHEPSRPPWGLAWRLAAGQIVAWGILYYAFTVVAEPIHRDTGWTRTFVNVGLSTGLLTWGLAAWPVGTWIQRRGAREPMTLAALAGGLAIMLLGSVGTPFAYLLAWALLGFAMAGALYEPAFAAVTRAFGPAYRRGITLITLVAGFASTLFVPLAQFAVDQAGWRTALLILGAAQIAIGVPLHWFGLPRDRPAPAAAHANSGAKPAAWLPLLRRDISEPGFPGLALWFSAHAAAATGLVFLLIPLLQSRQVPTATILQAVAVMGPMQVLGRFILTAYGGEFPAVSVGKWAMGALVAAVAVLALCPWNLFSLGLFAALFGLGNGVLTIVRGTVVAEFYGRDRYAELSGALAAPGVIAKAAAPLGLGAAWSATGNGQVVIAICALLVAVSAAGLWLAGVRQRVSRPMMAGAAA